MDNNLILPARAGVILEISSSLNPRRYFTRTSGGDPNISIKVSKTQ